MVLSPPVKEGAWGGGDIFIAHYHIIYALKAVMSLLKRKLNLGIYYLIKT